MKAYTDIEQSKKLAEILSIESADGWWTSLNWQETEYYIEVKQDGINKPKKCIPCWSLATLLDVLPSPQLSKDKLGSGKVGWMVSVYPNACRYDFCWHDNPIDAVFEIIIRLHSNQLL